MYTLLIVLLTAWYAEGKKPDGPWQMTVNYQKLNAVVSSHLWGCAQHCHHLRFLGHSPRSVPACIRLSKCFFQCISSQWVTRSICLQMEGTLKGLSSASPGLPAQPHKMSWYGSLRPVPDLLPHISKIGPLYWWDNVGIEDLLLVQDTLQTLLKHLQVRGCVVNPQKIRSPGTAVNFLGVAWLGKVLIVLEAVIDKVQAYPTKNV